jgi:energy-coupling factor transporter transmembrane protein EcfT
MAELMAPRKGRVAAWRPHLDVRLKLVLMAGVSVAGLGLGFAGLALLMALLILFFSLFRPAARVHFSELRWAFWLLALVFTARVFSTEGTALAAFGPITATREGLREGALICMRLVLVFSVGAAFIATTRSSEIKAGVQWFLKPLPWVPAERVATMLSLVARFMPVILEQAARTSDAQRARASENRRNPIRRLTAFGIPLMRRTFETADNLAVAMEARCYSEKRTDPDLAAGRRDWVFFGTAVAVILTATAL